jgi:hypothetical protein
LLILAGSAWRKRRRRSAQAVLPLNQPANDAVFLEMRPAGTTPETEAQSRDGAAILSTAPTATGNAQNAGWRSPAMEDKDPSERLRTALMPHLKRLMRDRTVLWLSRQRNQLLHAQNEGTEQVLDLHSRLEQIKGQFQERLIAQQQRITELDHALKTKESIIKDLLRSRITRSD